MLSPRSAKKRCYYTHDSPPGSCQRPAMTAGADASGCSTSSLPSSRPPPSLHWPSVAGLPATGTAASYATAARPAFESRCVSSKHCIPSRLLPARLPDPSSNAWCLVSTILSFAAGKPHSLSLLFWLSIFRLQSFFSIVPVPLLHLVFPLLSDLPLHVDAAPCQIRVESTTCRLSTPHPKSIGRNLFDPLA